MGRTDRQRWNGDGDGDGDGDSAEDMKDMPKRIGTLVPKKGGISPKDRRPSAEEVSQSERRGAAAGGGGDPREKRLAAATAAEEEDPENDDTWVSADGIGDVVGPVMFVLPTEPPTCLACDMNGKVFTDNVVNIVDGNPASAEPHDVRQVWVANKIAGTEKFRFKGRYGK